MGRRTNKTVNGSTTGFLYDGANIVQEQAGASPSANLLTGGTDQFFSRTDAGGTVTPLTDALGSVAGLTDASGAIQTSYSYEPFGKASATGTSSSNSQKYTGREEDGTGLFYNRARYYSPTLQRFISEDPIGMAGGINVYAYVGNDAINFSDPTGLEKRAHRLKVLKGGKVYGFPDGRKLILNGFKVYDFESGNYLGYINPGSDYETDWGMQFALAAPFAGIIDVGAEAAAETAATRFIARESGEVLDTSVIKIPGPVNSPYGKLDYLLGRVPSPESIGKGKFFAGVMGFTDETLYEALRQHLIENFGGEFTMKTATRFTVRGTMVGGNGRVATVLSVWQVTAEGTVDFITAMPK